MPYLTFFILASCKFNFCKWASCMPYFTFFILASCKSWETLSIACHTLLFFYFGFLQKLGNTKQQPSVRGASLILGPCPTFLFASTQAVKLQQPASLLLLPSASADPASNKPPPWLLDDDPPSIFLSSPSSDYDPVILFLYIC